MTVSTLINRVDYTGNGSTTVYAVPFPFFAGSDLDVYVDGVLQTLTTHYTVSITLDVNGAFSSANLTFLTAPANTKPVAIVRDLPLTQTVSTTNNSQLLPSVVEKALDRVTMVNQDTLNRLSRAVQLDASAIGSVTITPSDSKYLAWSGTTLVNKTATEMAADAGSGVAAQVVTNTANIATNTADIATLFQNGTSPWNASRTYVAGNVVNYTGSLWLCLVGNTNSAPTDVNTNWVKVITRTDTLYALPANHHDVRINYTDANTITVLAGSRVRSSDNTTDIVFSADRTCVLNASGSNGLDTGSEASNTWYNLYAIYNPTTLTSALLFSTVNEAVSGSITLPSGFTKKRQLKFAVRNNASSNIIPFFYQSNFLVRFDAVTLGVGGSTEVLNTGTATTFTDIGLSSFVPPISRISVLNGFRSQGASGQGTEFRRKGDTTNGFNALPGTGLIGEGLVLKFDLTTDNTQTIQYRNNVSGTTFLSVIGFYVTEVL